MKYKTRKHTCRTCGKKWESKNRSNQNQCKDCRIKAANRKLNRKRRAKKSACRTCGLVYAATPENFPSRTGLTRIGFVCLGCQLIEINKQQQRLLQAELKSRGMKRCHECHEWKPIEVSFHANSLTPDGHSQKCKDCVKVYQQANKKRIISNTREWQKANPEKVSSHIKRWQKANPRKMKMAAIRRRSRKESLPTELTDYDWQQAIEYFNGCCAVCGRQLKDLFATHRAAADHWIPVSYEGADNPGTVPENIVPLCHGLDGCNNKKNAKLPDVWLKEQYGTRKANEILARINAYFEWVKSQKEKVA